jgi:peptide/nickel transport system permease protein
MYRYLVRRLLLGLLTIWLVSIAVFVILRVTPGDPTFTQAGTSVTPERIEEIRKQLDLDKSYPEQYWIWITDLARGDLGTSHISGLDVTQAIKERFPVTLQLVVMTLAWVIVIGVPAGVYAALRHNGPVDVTIRFLSTFAIAVPGFWIATLVLLVPAELWGYAPPLNETTSFWSEPWDNMRQFGPPSLILALASIATTMRLSRSSLLEVLRSDYIRTARAKGLQGRTVVYGHALRNSIIPVVTAIGIVVITLLSGSLIIEQIFNLKGLGQLSFNAVLQKEYTTVQAMVMYSAAVVVLVNLLIDFLYAVIDPRIRYA